MIGTWSDGGGGGGGRNTVLLQQPQAKRTVRFIDHGSWMTPITGPSILRD